jgi:hypothetical protein
LKADIVTWLFGPPAWLAGVVGLVLYWWVAGEYAGDIRARLRSVESPYTGQSTPKEAQ